MHQVIDMDINIDAEKKLVTAEFQQQLTTAEGFVSLSVQAQIPYRSDLSLAEIQHEALEKLRSLLS